jgi:predicted lipid carrier protein YhbT
MISQLICPAEVDVKLSELFPHLIDVDLCDTNLGVRMKNILKRCGIETLPQLLSFSYSDLLQSDMVRGHDGFLNTLKAKLTQYQSTA